MESTVNKKVTVTLVLNEEEANWLKGIMQNPLSGNPSTEETRDRQLREAFWNALDYQTKSSLPDGLKAL